MGWPIRKHETRILNPELTKGARATKAHLARPQFATTRIHYESFLRPSPPRCGGLAHLLVL